MVSGSLLSRMGISPEAFERVALNALISMPKLAECTPESMDLAIIQSIEMGLLPDRRQAVILPFRGKAQLIPMIEGKLMLARRATQGLSIRARVVYADDEFRWVEGLEPVLEHVVSQHGSSSAEDITHAYAIAELPGAGRPEWVVMSRLEIERRRAKAPGKDGEAWVSYWPEMAEKTVLNKLLKRLPKQVGEVDVPLEMEGADLDADSYVLEGEATEVETIEPTKKVVKVKKPRRKAEKKVVEEDVEEVEDVFTGTDEEEDELPF